jgi:diacylglycerol kinase family enzyme
MDTPHLTWLLVNSASGSNNADAVTTVVEAMDAAGFPPQRVVALPSDTLPDRAELEAAGVNLLAVFTGDGTVNAALTGIYGWQGQVLVLPGGTQNLLARACHGESVATEIIERLGHGQLCEARRPLIRSAHGDALCEIVAGPGAIWSDVREALRDADVAAIANSVREAVAQSSGGPMVALADPALGNPDGYAAVRLYPRDGALAVDGYGAQGLADYAKQGLALVRRDFREGPHEELGVHPEVTCRSDAPIELMIDGERASGGPEERFALVACDLRFLVSADRSDGETVQGG